MLKETKEKITIQKFGLSSAVMAPSADQNWVILGEGSVAPFFGRFGSLELGILGQGDVFSVEMIE